MPTLLATALVFYIVGLTHRLRFIRDVADRSRISAAPEGQRLMRRSRQVRRASMFVARR